MPRIYQTKTKNFFNHSSSNFFELSSSLLLEYGRYSDKI